MKNLKTFKQFINEKYAKKSGEPLSDTSDFADEYLPTVKKIIGILGDDAMSIDSEGDDEDAYKAAEKAYSKGSSEDIDLPSQGPGGPFLSYNKKSNIMRYDDYGFTSFYFTKKSKFQSKVKLKNILNPSAFFCTRIFLFGKKVLYLYYN